ncbi:Fasciclin domain-containing protein [Chitinophaga sp. CF118]|uniref:fasciclin domain-containing protein n=1 Tax=Chitinophaga sp. CF118 TaxID=1884367 RepID=UPI0008E4E12A|nr:fasciclin domain-containing protein [Chitinophaga sp. CF118]SFE96556.1 Fasciclin domain-containing protein [Chitinophaga sp. CF118]
MKTIIRSSLLPGGTFFCLFLLFILLISSCRKKEFDEYYGRPDWLASPIYKQLEARKNFKHLLVTIDKAGYKDILSKAGYWTLFAPNDAAFEKYFQEKGIGGDDDIDSLTARKIVTYGLVYNAYRKDQLSSYQRTGGPDTSQAYKRKTAYYDWVYTESGHTGKIIAANRNGTYIANDNNNKNIPYFINGFMSANGLSAADYNFFYPNVPYTGFNVVDAGVVNADIAAENGIIHEIDKVILPLQNLERYLADNPEYSEFKRLLDKLVSYQSNADLTHRNLVLTGASDSVFVKLYSAALAFSPNNENYILASTDAQAGGWTLFVPKNDVLIAYEKEILVNYGTFEAAPPAVLLSLLNSHMWQTTVWPGKLSITGNSQREVPTFSLSDINDKKVLSNGFFYGINAVQDANVFRTVYGKAFLDPEYSLMTRALDADLKFSIINPSIQYTLFMMPDTKLRAAGYDFNSDRNDWSYQAPGGTIQFGSGAQDRLYRILQTSVLSTLKGELDNLSGEGIVEAWNGEYIRYSNNTVFASGNVDAGVVLNINKVSTAKNGRVYYTDGLLTFTENPIGFHIEKLAGSFPADFGSFYQYLKNTTLWTATKDILGTVPGNFYTILIPTNDAISAAVKDGWLPGDITTGTPNFAPTTDVDKEKVTRFINYHILNKNTIVPDGKKSGAFETLLRTTGGDLTFITINNQLNLMDLRDAFNNSAMVNISRSNNLSNRAVIHSINNYLRYNVQ